MSSDEEFAAALRVDLERRITEISSDSESAFGNIGNGEWFVFCMVCLAVPFFLVWYVA